jgi:signal recognition particle subunit SRP54
MGDVVSLVEKAEEAFDQKQAEKIGEKLRKQSFTLEDFLDQLKSLKKMGPLEDLLGMIPGMGKMKGLKVDEKDLLRVEAIVLSMTPEERARPQIIDGSRRRRIAQGSGMTITEVNHLLRDFEMMKKMMKGMMKGQMPRMAGIG